MRKLFGTILFTAVVMLLMPQALGSQAANASATPGPTQFETRVLQDKDGNVHVLSVVPLVNGTLNETGLWYVKYNANGRPIIPLNRITNSTDLQSADLAVDGRDNAIVVWADDNASGHSAQSDMNILHFNATAAHEARILTTNDSLFLWPSLGGDNNGTVYMTWTDYSPEKQNATVEYGVITSTKLLLQRPIASYNNVASSPPKAQIVFDNASEPLQVAWGESHQGGESVSTIDYVRLEFNGTVMNIVQVANVSTALRDVTITPIHDQGGAFIIWQTQVSNSSIYVSQISASGQLDYVRELNYTVRQAKYLTISMDFDNNIDLMWYQPSLPVPQTETAFPTNVTYLRMNIDGVVTQSGTSLFQTPIIAATVLSNGMLYGASPDGLVRAETPIQEQRGSNSLIALAVMSCVSLAGVAGTTLVEEGRYRWVSLYSRILRSTNARPPEVEESLKLLSRKPGLNLRDIKRLSGHRIHLTSLSRMEQSGLLASVRDGLSRRFYVKDTGAGQVDALRSRILLWIHDHPGIWEAQLAKELGLSQQLVHYHLKKLRETKLITPSLDRSGGRKLYRFADKTRDRQEPT